MNKLSSTKVAEVLSQVGPTLRAQQEKIAALQDKVAYYERKERAEKIASEMQAKNLDPESSYDEKVERLMAPSTNLDVVQEAITMSAPQVKLAAISDHHGNASDAESAFVAGLVAL